LEHVFFRLLGDMPSVTVVDLASGFGDHGRHLIRQAEKRRQVVTMIAVDNQISVLRIVREATPTGHKVALVQADARRLPFRPGSVDFVFCTLALHHFDRGDAGRVLSEMARIAQRGAACLDLQRSRLAIAAIDLLARFILREPIVKHDAHVSIRRAFDANEMKALGRAARWPRSHHFGFGWFQQALVARFDPSDNIGKKI
jgi:ubiquinone/menaquinone biosynthesis C-methylase UbiE